jgi:hypothetical protein
MVFPQGKLGGLNNTSDSRVFHAENFGSVVDGNDSGLAHFLRAVLEVSMATMITKCGQLKEMLVVTVKEARRQHLSVYLLFIMVKNVVTIIISNIALL